VWGVDSWWSGSFAAHLAGIVCASGDPEVVIDTKFLNNTDYSEFNEFDETHTRRTAESIEEIRRLLEERWKRVNWFRCCEGLANPL
jgi:hypothetical protein